MNWARHELNGERLAESELLPKETHVVNYPNMYVH